MLRRQCMIVSEALALTGGIPCCVKFHSKGRITPAIVGASKRVMQFFSCLQIISCRRQLPSTMPSSWPNPDRRRLTCSSRFSSLNVLMSSPRCSTTLPLTARFSSVSRATTHLPAVALSTIGSLSRIFSDSWRPADSFHRTSSSLSRQRSVRTAPRSPYLPLMHIEKPGKLYATFLLSSGPLQLARDMYAWYTTTVDWVSRTSIAVYRSSPKISDWTSSVMYVSSVTFRRSALASRTIISASATRSEATDFLKNKLSASEARFRSLMFWSMVATVRSAVHRTRTSSELTVFRIRGQSTPCIVFSPIDSANITIASIAVPSTITSLS